MVIKQRIDSDLKIALLAGDKARVSILRGLKSAILDAEIAANARATGLPEEQIVQILTKESKKRAEAAEMYRQGNSEERAKQEEAEKTVIATYLPAQLDDQALLKLVQGIVDEVKPSGLQDMGKVIAAVKERSAGQAEGARIAAAVKQQLSENMS